MTVRVSPGDLARPWDSGDHVKAYTSIVRKANEDGTLSDRVMMSDADDGTPLVDAAHRPMLVLVLAMPGYLNMDGTNETALVLVQGIGPMWVWAKWLDRA